jgi:lauroyl/myristoyl acyltransferase
LAEPLRQLRRAITQQAIRKAIESTASLPIAPQRAAVCRVVSIASHVPMLRRRVRHHMRLALGDGVPVGAERRYFRHLGWFLSNSLATFHRSVAETPVINEVKFDGTIVALDDAFAEGRGVVLTVPHWSGHELVAAVVARRHPMVMLVRQAASGERADRKTKWYRALGVETVLRPARASQIKDAVAYLKVLKSGKMLAITPDLLADPGQGVEVSLFGRHSRLSGGAFALAISAKAPMIRISGVWQPDSSVVLTFERAPAPAANGDRDAVLRACVQDWCRWFERKLRDNPENWLFWLDKRWSRFLRATPQASCRE